MYWHWINKSVFIYLKYKQDFFYKTMTNVPKENNENNNNQGIGNVTAEGGGDAAEYPEGNKANAQTDDASRPFW